MFSHLRADSRTDRLCTLSKLVTSRESFAGEATMLRPHMYEKGIMDQLTFSRYELNQEDFESRTDYISGRSSR